MRERLERNVFVIDCQVDVPAAVDRDLEDLEAGSLRFRILTGMSEISKVPLSHVQEDRHQR